MAAASADEIHELAAAPASISVDGQSVSERSAADFIALEDRAIAKAALAGTNANGGPRSAWGRTRAALAVPPGGGP